MSENAPKNAERPPAENGVVGIFVDGVGAVRRMSLRAPVPEIRIPRTPRLVARLMDPGTLPVFLPGEAHRFRHLGALSDGSHVYGFLFDSGPQFGLFASQMETTHERQARWMANLKQLHHIRRSLERCAMGPGPIVVLDHVRQTIGRGYEVTTWMVMRLPEGGL